MNGTTHPRRREERKKALLDELKRVLDQKSKIERKLELLRGQGGQVDKVTSVPQPVYSQPVDNTANVSKPLAKRERIEPPAPAPELKRPKLEESRFAEDIFQRCQAIVKNLMKLRDAEIFKTPVDYVKYNIPDYPSIIKNPMDLGTVLNKIRERKYEDPYQFRDDVRLIWANCQTYNGSTTPVGVMGVKMSEAWEKRWQDSRIEELWKDYLAKQRQPQQGAGTALASTSHAASAPQNKQDCLRRIRDKDKQLRELVDKAPSKKTGVPVDMNRDMSWEEKRKLSLQLGSLSYDKLNKVLEIIAECNPNMDSQSEDELELDIESLSNVTLWRLRQYLDAISNPPQQKPSKSASEKDNAGGGQGAQEHSSNPKYTGKQEPSHKSHSHKSNSTSSSDDSSSGSESSPSNSPSGTEENVSNEVKDSTADDPNEPKAPILHRGDVESSRNNVAQPTSVFVKPTRPAGKGPELSLQNAGAWASLADQTQIKTEGGEKIKKDGEQDALWSEFQTREQQQQRRAKERQEEEDKVKRAQDQKLKQEQEERERLRRQKEEEEARLREAEQQEMEATRRLREEQKAKELAELSNLAGTAKLCRADGMYAAMEHQEDVMGQLGLQAKNDVSTYADDDRYSDDE